MPIPADSYLLRVYSKVLKVSITPGPTTCLKIDRINTHCHKVCSNAQTVHTGKHTYLNQYLHSDHNTVVTHCVSIEVEQYCTRPATYTQMICFYCIFRAGKFIL